MTRAIPTCSCCRPRAVVRRARTEALKLLEQAAQADLNWAAPEIWTAEILAEDPERWSEALQHAAAALDRAEEEDEFLEAVALKAGLEIDVGKPTAARKTLADLPPLQAGVTLPPALALDFAHMFLEVGDVEEATQRFQAMVDADGRDADAWHGLGLCAEASNDEAGKRRAWLRVLALDAEKPLAPPLLSEAQMAEVAETTLRELPQRVRELIAHVPILIVDLPARDEVEPGSGPATARHVRGLALLGRVRDGGPARTHTDPTLSQEPGARRTRRPGTGRTDPHYAPARNWAFLRHVRRGPGRSRVGLRA